MLSTETGWGETQRRMCTSVYTCVGDDWPYTYLWDMPCIGAVNELARCVRVGCTSRAENVIGQPAGVNVGSQLMSLIDFSGPQLAM